MPTIKIEIDTGIEYSPTDGLDSAVKLHNFTVGTDGSLYKLPVLKNLKTAIYKDIGTLGPSTSIVPYRIEDVKKFQTSALSYIIDITPDYHVNEMKMFRRFVYLTTGSYGVIDINHDGERVGDQVPADQKSRYGEFEYDVYQYKKNEKDPITQKEPPSEMGISSLNPQILVDFNAQYADEKDRSPTKPLRCVFPMQYMWKPKDCHGENSCLLYKLLMQPRNIIDCSMDATSNNPDVQPLYLKDKPKEKRQENDLARGCVPMGNRMFFYSALDNAIYVSSANKFKELMPNPDSKTEPFRVIPPEELQAITDFNGNIITFTPTGMERWLLSTDDTAVIQRDPTFHYDHRVRYGGSFVKANRDLYYYTDDFQVYRLNPNLTVDSVFNGNLPFYKPLDDFLIKDTDFPMAYFKMLGYRFVSVGPWLYNIDSNTWSTYRYDGYLKPEDDIAGKTYTFENITIAGSIHSGADDIVCTHSSICHPLTYQEMQSLPDDIEATWVEDKYNFGEVAFFTTRMFQDEQKFSLDGVMVYVRGGILETGSKMWLKVLKGSDLGDFTESDKDSYGVEATYQPVDATVLGEDQREYVGRFLWEGMNLKTDRFRLQFITKEKKGIVVQSVLANISTLSDTQNYLTASKMQTKEESQKQPS